MSNSKESFEQLRETPSIVASVQAAGQSRIAKTAPKATNSDQQKQRRTVCPLKGQPAETWIRIGIGVGVGESSLAEERNVNKKTNTNTICKDSRDCAVNVLRICSNLLPQLAKLCRAIVDVDAGVAAGLLHSELNAAKIAPHFGVSRAVGCAVAVGARTLLQKEICDDWRRKRDTRVYKNPAHWSFWANSRLGHACVVPVELCTINGAVILRKDKRKSFVQWLYKYFEKKTIS